ncbi:TonB-dependent receptor plug domain-containing protein [Granulicella sibirica]|uniref:TonB-dependent receptor plug domain-containing protein n=1 Tax=Granulicella sibirica TaxID=2479048 RepID=UPI0010086EFA|nr:TonB-dependent receptor [Granulicella sibirica]
MPERSITFAFLLLGVFGPEPASSQTATLPIDLEAMTLEQLTRVEVFTASRHLQAVQAAPASVTLVTAKEIREHGYRTLADVLQGVRGFFITNDRNYSSIGVRGFARPGDFNTRILLLVDGHRLNDNIYDEAMIGREFPIDVDLIDRIEIIRGPVSSLYGSNALFGVINIFTRRGRDVGGFELSSSIASLHSEQGRITYGRKFNKAEVLISGSFYGSRGHNALFYPEFDSPQTGDGVARHADDEQVGSALATVSFHDFTLRSVFGTREKGIPTGAYGTIFGNSGTRTTDSHGYVDLQYEHTVANSWIVMARGFYDRYGYHGTYIYPSQDDPAQISPEADFGDGRWAGGEVQLTKTVLSRNRVVAGFEFRDNLRQNQQTYDLNPYTPDLDDRRTSFVAAPYLQDEVTLTKSLILNAGLRYDYYSSTRASVDPRVALIFRPYQGTAVKLMYGEAFRAPNNYEKYYAVAPNVANPEIQPEKIRTTEGVWEQELPAHLSASVSVFYSRMDGLITQAVGTDSDSLIYQNLQQVNSVGAELEVRQEPVRGTQWVVSYSSQGTKDSDTGQFLSNSPRSLAKVSFTQKLPVANLKAGFDAQYRSRIITLSGSSISPYTLVNATLLGRSIGKHGELSLSAYNLLNKSYSDPASGANTQQAIPQDGRSLRVQITWRRSER